MIAVSTSFATKPHDDVRTQRNVSWEAFASFLVERGDGMPRVAYLEGTLETMSPSRNHELLRNALRASVEAHLDHLGARYANVGSWLLKSAPHEAGLEPDDCFLLDNLGKDRPDLALEVVWTSGSISKLEIYRRLGVPEVWIWRDEAISVHVLGEDSHYSRRDQSALLPAFDFVLALQMMTFEALSDVKLALRRHCDAG